MFRHVMGHYSPWPTACFGYVATILEQFMPRGRSFATCGVIGELWHWYRFRTPIEDSSTPASSSVHCR
jgi:hypothetical protein